MISLGWVAPLIYIFGSLGLGFTLADYNTISQTLSEIGEVGSPYYMFWMIFCVILDAFIILFGVGILLFARRASLSKIPAVMIICHGFAGIGSSVFASPHPFHNIFGASHLLWYCVPLIFALTWKTHLGHLFRNISIVTFILVIVIGTILNLNPMFDPLLYPMEFYGLAQRYVVYGINLFFAFTAITILKRTENIG